MASMVSSEAIPLRPLKDQVGGNFMLLEIDENYICKPLQARETLFYETLPDELRNYTPEYKGMLSVSFAREENGRHKYTGYPVKKNGILNKKTMDLLEMDNLQYLRVSKRNIEAKGVENSVPSWANQDGTNPWINFRVKTMDTILDMREDHTKQFKYIILENLTSKFKHPCIMDLKLGTRTYSDDMSDEKKQIHLKKCDTTTSKPLGIRLAGLQVFDACDGKYRYVDKYGGSMLNTDALIQALTDFFFNGFRHNIKLIPQLVEKLKHLRETLRHLDSYRLFSSSLLVIYEGGEEVSDSRVFGNGKISSTQKCPGASHSQNDSLDFQTESLLDTTPDPLDTTPDPLDTTQDPPVSPLNGTSRQTHSFIDIRMIDFGNVTSRCFTNDPVKYDGPDDGYILGLTNIISVYEEFLTKYQSK